MFGKNKIRILFAINNLTYGGIQTQALGLAKGLKKKGAVVYFFWTTKAEKDFVDKELLLNDFKIIDGRFLENNYWLRYSWKLHRYLPLIRVILLMRFYRINYILPYQNRLSNIFGVIHKFTGANKTIFHIRNTVLENEPKNNWHLRHALLNKPTIIANSNHARIKFKKIYGAHYNFDIHTIYNGIEVRTVDDAKDWKKHFGVTSIDFVVSVIANFYKEKDYDTIFKAWSHFIDQTKSNSILLIAGDEGIEGSRSSYLSQVKKLGLENHVKFLGRTSFNIELLSITHCNILSTTNEGFPNSAIETLAMGKPLLATNIDGLREVVGEKYPIPLFQKGDDIELSENLLKVFKRELDLEQLRNYSANRFKNFSTEKLIESYSRILGI